MLHLRVVRPSPAHARVVLRGELDVTGVQSLGRLVGSLAGELRSVVLDLSALEFVDVAGWRALRSVGRDLRERGVDVHTVGSPATDRVVAMLGPLAEAS